MKDVVFSPCRKYRYVLPRPPLDPLLPNDKSAALFVMLNPSTADEVQDDPTVRRCRGYAERWGCNGLVVANIYAYRSTDPRALKQVDDPVGPENDGWLEYLALDHGDVVCAWGSHATEERVARFMQLMSGHIERGQVRLWCLGQNKNGSPKHPLYLRADQELLPYDPYACDPESSRIIRETADKYSDVMKRLA